MFTWLNKQGVRSDRGFEVQRLGRFEAEYREGVKVITLYVESGMVGGLPCIIIDPNAFERWDGDPPGRRLPPEEEARLLQNFREAMEFQGMRVTVEAGIAPK